MKIEIEGPEWILVFVVLLMAFGMGGCVGGWERAHVVTQRLRREAIEHNVAEYVCDPATGETEFRWKDVK